MNAHIEPTRIRQGGRRVTQTKSGAEIIEACRTICREASFAKINGITVDLFSASAIITVYDAVNEANQTKFRNLPVTKMARIAFQLIK